MHYMYNCMIDFFFYKTSDSLTDPEAYLHLRKKEIELLEEMKLNENASPETIEAWKQADLVMIYIHI